MPRLHPAPAQTIYNDHPLQRATDERSGSLLEWIGGKFWFGSVAAQRNGAARSLDPVWSNFARGARLDVVRDYYRSLVFTRGALASSQATTRSSSHLDCQSRREEERVLRAPDLTIPTIGGNVHLEQ